MILAEHGIIAIEQARIARELRPKECSVYALFARDGDGPMYVKIGISANPSIRMAGVQTGCPIKIKRGIAFTCKSRKVAVAAEQALLSAYSHCRASGEWIRLDWTAEAKAGLHEALEMAMDQAGAVNLREVRPENLSEERRCVDGRRKAAQLKASQRVLAKYRLNVELRTPTGVA